MSVSQPSPPIRLPSYKELTAASLCDDFPRAQGAGGPGRSSLFTAGIVHGGVALPPLRVPTAPRKNSLFHADPANDRERFLDLAQHCPPAPPSSASSLASASSSGSSSTANANANANGHQDRRASTSPSASSLSSSTPTSFADDYRMNVNVNVNGGGSRDGWPRVPLPSMSTSTSASASTSASYSSSSNNNNTNNDPARGAGRLSPSAFAPPLASPHLSLPSPSYGPSHPLTPSNLDPSSALLHGHAQAHAQVLAQGNGHAAQPQPRLKFSHAKAGGRTKKQALSCFFCRERKIACGRPERGERSEPFGAGGGAGGGAFGAGSNANGVNGAWGGGAMNGGYGGQGEGGDGSGSEGPGACNQCARRKIPCTYPTVSHRGQHSRIKSAARKAGTGGGGSSPHSASTPPTVGTREGTGAREARTSPLGEQGHAGASASANPREGYRDEREQDHAREREGHGWKRERERAGEYAHAHPRGYGFDRERERMDVDGYAVGGGREREGGR